MNTLPAPWLRVWLVILLKANWQPATWREGTKEMQIQPGSLVTSIGKLAVMSGASARQVRGALEYFKTTRMATHSTTSRYSIISITKWVTYQNAEDVHDTVGDTANDTPDGVIFRDTLDDILNDTVTGRGKARSVKALEVHPNTAATQSATRATTRRTTTIEEVKNKRKEHMSNSGELDSFQNAASPKRKPRSAKTEIDPEIRRWFESEFWPLYPRHEGKKPALLAAAKEATTPQKRTFCLERLKAQLPAYLQRKARSGQSTIPLASTWFNQERADDELQLDPEPGRRLPVSDDYPEYVHPTEKTNLQ